MYEFDEKLVVKILRPGKEHCYEVLIIQDNRLAELVSVFQLYEDEEVVAHYGAYGEEGKKPLLAVEKDPLITSRPRQWTSIQHWAELPELNKKDEFKLD